MTKPQDIPNLPKLDAFLEELQELEDRHGVHIGQTADGIILFDQARPLSLGARYRWERSEERFVVIGYGACRDKPVDNVLSAMGKNYFELQRALDSIPGVAVIAPASEKAKAVKELRRLLQKQSADVAHSMRGGGSVDVIEMKGGGGSDGGQ